MLHVCRTAITLWPELEPIVLELLRGVSPRHPDAEAVVRSLVEESVLKSLTEQQLLNVRTLCSQHSAPHWCADS